MTYSPQHFAVATTHPAALRAEDISIRYGRRDVVRGLSLSPLQPGTVTALIGPNGVGKSSILRGIAGLHPMQGRVQLGDIDLSAARPALRSRYLSYMPQSLPADAALTVLDMLVAALCATGGGGSWSNSPTVAATKSEIPWLGGEEEAARRGLVLLHRLGIASLAMRGLRSLSGGQRQLVALAQALVREPAVLLLDEPTSALDLRFQLQVMHLLRSIAAERGVIILVVLHDLSLAARFADEIILLTQGQLIHGQVLGRVLGQGRPEAVLTPAALAQAFGVRARVERCSRGFLQILADEAAEASSDDHMRGQPPHPA